MHETLAEEPRGTVEAVDIRCATTLNPVRGAIEKPVVILLAVRFGDVLLIDQRVVAHPAVAWRNAAE